MLYSMFPFQPQRYLHALLYAPCFLPMIPYRQYEANIHANHVQIIPMLSLVLMAAFHSIDSHIPSFPTNQSSDQAGHQSPPLHQLWSMPHPVGHTAPYMPVSLQVPLFYSYHQVYRHNLQSDFAPQT